MTKTQSTHGVAIELLEPRRLLAVIPPATPTVSIIYAPQGDGVTNNANIAWTDNNTEETGYRVEWSDDNATWPTANFIDVPVSSYSPGGTVLATQSLDAGQKCYYRARAVGGANFSDWSGVRTPITGVDKVVQVTATTEAGSTSGTMDVTLHWSDVTLPSGVSSFTYKVSRKERQNTTWGTAVSAGSALSYTDEDVDSSHPWEYMVQRFYNTSPTSVRHNGYAYVGFEQSVPMAERGTALLVVDQTQAAPLESALLQFAQDLIGDGWSVQRIDVPRDGTATAASVKQLINSVYQTHTDLRSIVLIGHVPVPYSGLGSTSAGSYIDGHSDHRGPWPADAYYGDLDETAPWTDTGTGSTNVSGGSGGLNVPGDGKFDNEPLPSKIEASVGRIDFANLSWTGMGSSPAEIESGLLARYFQKNHDFRQRVTASPTAQALIDDHFGSANSYPDQGSWQSFSPLVNPSNVHYGDWTTTLDDENYLWAYGGGPGSSISAAGVVQRSHYDNESTSPTLKSVFNLLFGSYFGDWNMNDNLLRYSIAGKGTSLAAMFGGNRPAWFLHTMALGEPLGEALLLTQNNRFIANLRGADSPTAAAAYLGVTRLQEAGGCRWRTRTLPPSSAGGKVIQWGRPDGSRPDRTAGSARR